MQEFFSNVEDANLPNANVNFFESDHRFLIRVQNVETFTSRPPKNTPFFVLVGEILWTTSGAAIGTSRKYLQKLNVDAAGTAMKGVMIALHDLDAAAIEAIDQETRRRRNAQPPEEGMWSELCNRAAWTQKKLDQLKATYSQRQLTQKEWAMKEWPLDPHVGKLIRLETRGAQDKDFTFHNWSANHD